MSFVKWALVTLVTLTIQNNGFIIKGVTSTRWWRISRRRFRSWCYSSIEQLKMESLNYEPASIKIRKKKTRTFPLIHIRDLWQIIQFVNSKLCHLSLTNDLFLQCKLIQKVQLWGSNQPKLYYSVPNIAPNKHVCGFLMRLNKKL